MAGKLAAHTPFAYRSACTVLHRVSAGLKLLCVIFISALACSSIPGLAVSLLLLFAASCCARIPPWELLKGAKPLVILSVCIVIMKTFGQGGGGITTPEIIIFNIFAVNASGFYEGIVVALRVLCSFAAAALLFAVTTMRELRLSLGAVESLIKKILLPKRARTESIAFFSLGLSLMLGFIPRFFDLWEASNIACDARSHRRGLRRLLILVPLVTERMMEAAADTALALEARALGQANPTR